MRWYDDPLALAADPEVDVVVELIGGAEGVGAGAGRGRARRRKARRHRQQGADRPSRRRARRLAEANGVALAFEAAVAGGIPIIKTLREGLAGNRIERVYGILNGTCNYILTDDARERARVRRGARRGAAARLCRGRSELRHRRRRRRAQAGDPRQRSRSAARSTSRRCDTEGIRHVSPLDIAFADELGYRIKLLGVARLTENGLEQRVHPCMVPLGTPIAEVEGVFNAVVAEGDFVGRMFFEGRGAGGGADGLGGGRRPRRHRRAARSLPAFGVPAAALAQLPAGADGAPRGRLLSPADGGRPARRHGRCRGRLRDDEVSIESLIQRGAQPGEPCRSC